MHACMRPRVSDLIIREALNKLNLRYEELASVMLGQFSADSGPPRTMAQLMLAHRKVSCCVMTIAGPCRFRRAALSFIVFTSHDASRAVVSLLVWLL